MPNRPRLTTARRITVFCPVSRETLGALARGELSALAEDAVGGRILGYIERCPDLGDFGAYRGVCEVAIGLEAFTSAPHARPAMGAAGERSHSATAVITTYARDSIPDERLETVLRELCTLHPWEVPVIEVATVMLVGRPGADARKTPLGPAARGARSRKAR
jgi:hypothetical protein